MDKHSLSYYKKRMVVDGVAATIAAATPAAPAPGSAPTTADDEKENSCKTEDWDAYEYRGAYPRPLFQKFRLRWSIISYNRVLGFTL